MLLYMKYGFEDMIALVYPLPPSAQPSLVLKHLQL